jgi:1-acyl-sn-glycerol-3-phosphate acyltransferase
MALSHFFLPFELKRARIEVQVVGNGLDRLKALRGKRTVIVSNHGDMFDPEVVFTLSNRLGEDFHFIAARECFDWVHGAVGWFFQNLGCYSVARGEADVESFKMTREILVNGKRKLVMFPEGEVTRQPNVIPLRKGATRLFFEGQEELNKQRPGEELFIQPLGIRWRYRDDVVPVLASCMTRIEKKLRIVPPSRHLLDRVEFASMTMAHILEQEYNAPQRPELPFENRIVALREHVLRSMALALNVELNDEEEHLVWFRHLNIALNNFVNANMAERSDFQKRLHKELSEKVERMRNDLIRMQHMIGITENPGFQRATPESLANRISKIEREVLGGTSYKGVRLAEIGVGDPIPLLDYLSDYERDRDATIDMMTDKVHSAIQSIIDKLEVSQHMDYAASLPK